MPRAFGQRSLRQMQGELLDGSGARACQAVELGATRQGGESVGEFSGGVAIEIPLTREASPSSENGEGHDFAFGEGRFGAWALFTVRGTGKSRRP